MKNSADLGGCYSPRHILQKPNSIIALLFNQIFPYSQKSFAISLFVFLLTKNNTTSAPCFLGQQFNNLKWAALFDVILTPLVQYH